MDNATREHFIKIMREKIEGEVSKSLNRVDDLEQLGKHLIQVERPTEEEKEKEPILELTEQPRLMKVEDLNIEEEEDLFPEEEEEDYQLEELVVDEPSKAIADLEDYSEDYNEDFDGSFEEVNTEEEIQDFLQEENESPLLPLQDNQIVNPKTDEMVELPQPEFTSKEEAPKTNKQDRKFEIEALKKQYQKDYDILQTMHRLERWELDKQQKLFEKLFVEEYEEKLNKLENSLREG